MAKRNQYLVSDDHHGGALTLQHELGMAGWGVYHYLLSYLHANGGKIKKSELEGLAFSIRVDYNFLNRVVTAYDLFKTDGEFVWSEDILNQIKHRDAKSESCRASVKTRWEKERNKGKMSQFDQNCQKTQSVDSQQTNTNVYTNVSESDLSSQSVDNQKVNTNVYTNVLQTYQNADNQQDDTNVSRVHTHAHGFNDNNYNSYINNNTISNNYTLKENKKEKNIFCNDITNSARIHAQDNNTQTQNSEIAPINQFLRIPTLEEVKAYFDKAGISIDPQYFLDRNAVSGWMTSKGPVRDWKAWARCWDYNRKDWDKEKSAKEREKAKSDSPWAIEQRMLLCDDYWDVNNN